MTTAKLFWNGNSQAVRLPKEFRFEGKEVKISKQGNQVIIEPLVTDWDWLDSLGEPDAGFETAVNEIRVEAVQERDWSVFE